jgi:hypothetical protein
MGTKIIVSGLQDAVIETMIELGMTLPDVDAVLDLDDALILSRSMTAQLDRREVDGMGDDFSSHLHAFDDFWGD